MATIPWEEVREVVDAVLDLPAADRAPFLDKACPQSSVRRYVESLILSYESGSPIMDEPAVARYAAVVDEGSGDAWLGRRLGPYELVDEIGHGGMGSVYRAVRSDDQFRQQVAIKVVRGGLETRFVRERFIAERQILADLDHPNIARLLDGGSTTDGQPYFVMEYIEGLPLDRYCDQHRLTIYERLELFRTVCAAVQYAHQKLVIHRDIKPGNILVAADGTPKLLDFGIAKIVTPEGAGAASEQTRTQARMLTPEYASPEQIRGEIISTASDVYSLGVVLYELLTGRSPYGFAGGTPAEIDRAIANTEPLRPSTAISRPAPNPAGLVQPSAEDVSATREGSPQKLRRRLKGDLDTIVLKAIRKEHPRRYSSVEQFSEDIRRHMEGLPVLARKDTFAYRAGKFARRHSVPVAAGLLVLASLATGLVSALREGSIARTQRARAEQRFNDVRALANSLLFDVYDSIEDLPGSTAARKSIVDKALHYLDSLSREAQGDAGLQRELSSAYERIGDVQGNSLTANLGDSTGALASYQKAVAIRAALYQAKPSRLDDAVEYARVQRKTAHALLLKGATADAWKTSQRATAVAEDSEREFPDERHLLIELSQDYSTEADILGGNFGLANMGNADDALKIRQKQVGVEEKLLKLDPNDAGVQRSFAVSVAKTGDEFVLLGEWREALDQFLRAQASFQRLAGSTPGRKALDALQSIYSRVYFAERAVGNNQAALEAARRGLNVAQKMSAADKSDVRAHLALVIDYGNLAAVWLAMDQIRPALEASNQAVSTIDRLIEVNRSDGELPAIRAAVYTTAGEALSRSSKSDKWADDLQIALRIYSEIHSADPDNADGALQLAGEYNDFAKLRVSRGSLSGAEEMIRKSLAISEPLCHSAHPSEGALYSAAESYTIMGDATAREASIHESSGRISSLQQARGWYEQSLKTWALVREPGYLTPSGDDCVPPSAVKIRLAEVSSRLEQSGGK